MMTDRELMQQALRALDRVMRHGSAVQEAKDILRAALRDGTEQPIIKNYLEKDNSQPQRTHWEGCEEVHPECKKPEQEESEAVRAAWMAGYTEGEREAIENQTVQQQEPLAWFRYETVYEYRNQLARCTKDCIGAFPVYTAPQRREWVGLTDEEIMSLLPVDGKRPATTFARSIEAKLREKNNV